MFSKSFIAYAFLLALTASVNAQAAISPGLANGVTVTPPPIKIAINPGYGIDAPPPPLNVLQSRAINALFDRALTRATIQSLLNVIKAAAKSPRADGVTITPPPVKFTVDIDEGLEPPLPPPDALQSRVIDGQLLVDRALASSAKALLHPPGNGVIAPPPVQLAAPPGNGVAEAAPPSQPAAPDALPVRAFNAELLADRGLASSAKSIFQSIVNDVKLVKSSPPSNGVTAAPPPPVQPVAPPSNGVTAAPPPAQPVAPPPTIPDALPVRAIDAELLVDRALASSANPPINGVTAAPPPPQPVAPPSNGVSAAPPPAQAAAPPSNSVTDAATPPPVIPDALPVRAVGAGAANRRTASSKRTWASRWSANLS
ncbi:hypothetical protein EDB84DRAFT_1557999 [Lactarius hengduanensis]|nr:hypothetical protein EDB84DRAFT_1557999 [Lactarius hengduanensis]